MSQKEVNRKLSCILSTDVVGYSRLMEENEASTVEDLEENKKLIGKLIEDHNGRVVDSPGDNLLAEFNSAVKALDCAVKIQKEVKIKNAGLAENRRMQFRIGLNLGDVIEDGGSIYGNGVNIAARLEGLARPGEIYISRNFFDQVKTKLVLGYEYLGEHDVKNISEPVRVYRVLTDDEFAGKVIGENNSRRRNSRGIFRGRDVSGQIRLLIYSSIVILILMTGAALTYHRWNRDRIPSRINLAILPFQTINLTGDTKAFASGLIATMNAQLTKLRGQHPVQIFSPREIREKNINTVEKAIIELGANLVMDGTLQQFGKQIRIDYTMFDAKSEQLTGDTITDAISDPFSLMDSVVDSVLCCLGIDLLPEEKDSISIRTTQQPKAYNYYMTAVGYLQDYHKSENVQNAIRILEDALELDSKFAEAWAALGEARWIQYKYEKDTKYVEEALSACTRSLKLNINQARGRVCLGNIFTGTGKYEEAVDEFKRALDLEPGNDEACTGLGSTYEQLGLFSEAEKTYRRAIELKPDYWEGYNQLGSLYYMQGRPVEAAEQFIHVTRLVPDHHFGYSNLGAVYLFEGRYSDAIQELEHSVALRPTEQAYSNLGTAYFYQRKYSKAAAAYEEAIGLNEKEWILWGNLGDARYWDPAERTHAGEAYRKALTLGEQRLLLNPRDMQMLGFMAYYHAMMDEKEAAQKYMKLALDEDPQDPELFFNLAQTCYRLGDKDQALDWLKKALKTGLSNETVQNTPLFYSLSKSQEYQDILNED